VGFRLHADLLAILLAVGLMLVATYSLTWVFISLGLVAGSAQAAQMSTLIVIPLAFVSSA
jgi:ABC-2 type transport system permease protein